MLVIGVSGGIGSGKTILCQLYQAMAYPIFYADTVAKEISNSAEVIAQIKTTFGSGVLNADGSIARQTLANIVFKDEEALHTLNSILHPKVGEAFEKWTLENAKADFGFYEAAILFEKGLQSKCAYSILVTAPVETKIKRVQKRSAISREEVLARMGKQWPDEKKRILADFIVDNSGNKSLIEQANKILEHIKDKNG